MNQQLKVGIIGDYRPDHLSHIATNDALAHASSALSVRINVTWVPTPSLEGTSAEDTLEAFDAIWCAPGSPYASLAGALRAIRFAREMGRPFIGT